MDRAEFAAHIDHTVLGPETTPADVERVVDEAAEYGMNACVPPCYVPLAAERVPDVTLATVVGFPHGQNSTAVKEAEAERAWKDGADELDVVTNVGRLKAGEYEVVREELAAVVAATPLDVKVIIETALLSNEEKHRVCEAAREAGAAMVKTSTGFAEGVASETQRANDEAVNGGARVEDVELMSEYLPVKASGGIGSAEKARTMLDAGAERIGASSGVTIVEGFTD